LIHLAVGKRQLFIVKELIEKHEINPTSVGEVCMWQNLLADDDLYIPLIMDIRMVFNQFTLLPCVGIWT